MEEQIFRLVRRKMWWIVITLVAALSFYFLLPLSLIFLPDVMNRSTIVFGISWAWLYAFLQFPLTWFFVWFYHRITKKIERRLGEIAERERYL